MISAVIIMLAVGVVIVAVICLAVTMSEPSLDNWQDEQDRRRASLFTPEMTPENAKPSWTQLNRDALWPQTPQHEGDPIPKPFREVRED